jgi:GntR family transcriptional regulator
VLIRIQSDVDTPIYQQIIDQVKAQVADGTIKKGDRLPPVRELSYEIGVNVNTVYKAYLELETQGIIRMRVGYGVTVIAERQARLRDAERERIIRDMIHRLKVEAYHLGFDEDYLVDLLRQDGKPEEGGN